VAGNAVFIEASSKGVYIDPVVPITYFGSKLSRYLSERRPLAAWEALLRGMIAEGKPNGPDPDDLDAFFKRSCQDAVDERLGKTPFKKRPKLDISSPTLDAGYEVTMPELEGTFEKGEDKAEVIARNWPVLVRNLATLKELVIGARTLLKEQSNATKAEFKEIDYVVATLSNLIGIKPSTMGAGTVFSLMGAMTKDLEAFKIFLSGHDTLDPQMGSFKNYMQVLNQQIDIRINSVCAPFQHLYNATSRDFRNPAGLLFERLEAIEQQVGQLKQGSLSQPATSAHPGTSFMAATIQNPLSNNSSATSSMAPGLSMVEFQKLEARVLAVEERLKAEKITVGGESFASRSAVAAFMSLYAPGPEAYIYFMDAPMLLSLAFSGDASSSDQVLSFESMSLKAGYKSSEEANVVASFRLELPAFFGKDSKNSLAARDMRVLPAIPTHAQFDSGDGYVGVRHTLDKGIEAAQQTYMEGASLYMKQEASFVARQMISESATWLRALSHWMSQTHTDLTNRGADTKDAWQLISHGVRTIFADLHQARVSGRGPFPPGEKSTSIVWGALRGLGKMREFSEARFSAHPRLSHILNLHLQNNAVMKVHFEAYKEDQDARYKKLENDFKAFKASKKT
jgi:hypothetical protein